MQQYLKYIIAFLVVAPAPFIWMVLEPMGVSKLVGFILGAALGLLAILIIRKF